MTINHAATVILKEVNRPLSAKEIAKHALEQGLASSNAKDPIHSLAQTLEKNIRDGTYNDPELIFIYSPRGRLIDLPSAENKRSTTMQYFLNTKEIKLNIPEEILEKLQLATQAKIEDNFDDTVNYILKKGLVEVAPEIKKSLSEQLSKFDEWQGNSLQYSNSVPSTLTSPSVQHKSNEPDYIERYRKQLNDPNSLISRMKNSIEEKKSIIWKDLKQYLDEHFDYNSETSGSFDAALKVLEIDGYCKIEGRGDKKRIFV